MKGGHDRTSVFACKRAPRVSSALLVKVCSAPPKANRCARTCVLQYLPFLFCPPPPSCGRLRSPLPILAVAGVAALEKRLLSKCSLEMAKQKRWWAPIDNSGRRLAGRTRGAFQIVGMRLLARASRAFMRACAQNLRATGSLRAFAFFFFSSRRSPIRARTHISRLTTPSDSTCHSPRAV